MSGKERVGEVVGDELFYMFVVFEFYEELRFLLLGRLMEEQFLVVERIQKCNYLSFVEGNKEKLEKLFGFFLEYVGDLVIDDLLDFRVIDKLVVCFLNL